MEERVCELQELEVRVEKVWEETRFLYEEVLEISLLQRELEQAERWLSSYESTLMAEDYGVGVDHAEGWSKRTVGSLRGESLRGVSSPEGSPRGGVWRRETGTQCEVKRTGACRCYCSLDADHQHSQQVELQQ